MSPSSPDVARNRFPQPLVAVRARRRTRGRIVLALAGLALLAGCIPGQRDREMRSDIIVEDDRRFVFEATAFDKGEYAKDTNQGEALRTGILMGELDRKRLCQNGYTIQNREERVIGNAPASQGREWLLRYHGVCK